MSSNPEPGGFFLDRFDLAEGELEHVLGDALAQRGDHADLYFEFTTSESVAGGIAGQEGDAQRVAGRGRACRCA